MVELKLEIVQADVPKDCYIAVRVGETQKLSRLSNARTYKFSRGDYTMGRIEVFKRIGTCSIGVDPKSYGRHEVSVDCGDSLAGMLKLQVDVESESKAEPAEIKEPEDEKKATKFKAAKEYLNKHNLEARLASAMQLVLHEQPEDPAAFMAQQLLSGTTKFTPSISTAIQAPQSVLPFSAFYTYNFKSMSPAAFTTCYAKFPVKQGATLIAPQSVLPFNEFYTYNFKSMSPAAFATCYAKFPLKQGATLIAPQSVLPFSEFYTYNFKSMSPAAFATCYAKFPLKQGATLIKARTQDSPPTKAYNKLPSTGTWLQARPKKWLFKSAAPAGLAKTAWSFKGLRSASAMSCDELCDVERALTKALLNMSGELLGDYFPLRSSSSYIARPTGMSQEEELSLKAAGLFFQEAGDPSGRGVFTSALQDFAVWVNAEGHHVQVLVRDPARLKSVAAALRDELCRDGYRCD